MEYNPTELSYKDYVLYSPYMAHVGRRPKDGDEIFKNVFLNLSPEIQMFIKSEKTAGILKAICDKYLVPVEDVADLSLAIRDIVSQIRSPEILRELPEELSLEPEDSSRLISEIVNELLIPIKQFIGKKGAVTPPESRPENSGQVINLRKNNEI